MRPLLLAGPLAALFLSGCFESRDVLLLDPAAGVTPMAEGTYVADDDDKTELTVTRNGNWYRIAQGSDVTALLMTPLPHGAYAVAVADAPCADAPNACTWDYAVVKLDGARVLATVPNCETDSGIVGSWLSTLSDGADICYFTSGANLQKALSAIAAQRPTTTTYTRR